MTKFQNEQRELRWADEVRAQDPFPPEQIPSSPQRMPPEIPLTTPDQPVPPYYPSPEHPHPQPIPDQNPEPNPYPNIE